MPRKPATPKAEPKAKRGPGRPSRCTPELTEKVCNEIADGAPLETAARICGIDPGTLRRWRDKADAEHPNHHARYRAFREALTLAEDQRLTTLVRHWKNAAIPHPVVRTTTKQVLTKYGTIETLTETVETVEWDWRAAESLASRYDPENFAKRSELAVTGKGGGPIEVEQKVERTPVDTAKILRTNWGLEEAGKRTPGNTAALAEALGTTWPLPE